MDMLPGQQHGHLHFISSLPDKLLCGECMDRIKTLPQPTRLRPMDRTLPQNPGACLIVSAKKPCFECIRCQFGRVRPSTVCPPTGRVPRSTGRTLMPNHFTQAKLPPNNINNVSCRSFLRAAH
jgi:hypothetical protein